MARRTESLFDNRYRYDHIYPRGRSGETLRAYDTHTGDTPVVIKRPASQDAPPMRAGQEVSINTERQALERLAGHPVLTELRGTGTFRVGGHTHAYIVMDLARGELVEEMVFERAAQGAYLSDLEALVIVDRLLDLLVHAHDRQVIYNDVDAKHLFWDRATYQLKVIDWGNAVFLDEPGTQPQVNRASDIYQCGELLYFIFTGGNRLAVEVQEDDTFYVNFGPDAERIPARLQAVITRAVNPDPRRRFGSISELRATLEEYRRPLEKTRDDMIGNVRRRVRATASQEELAELAADLEQARASDPGYPPGAELAAEIDTLLRQITVQADLDAILIYLESANWTRALALLRELLPQAGPAHAALVQFLVEATATLDELGLSPAPTGFAAMLEPLFSGDLPGAGQVLITTSEARVTARRAQWLLAERLAALVDAVVLLRPHLVRLRHDLGEISGLDKVLEWLDEVEAELDRNPVPGLTGLQVIYQQADSNLARLQQELEAAQDHLSIQAQENTYSAVERARHAARTVVAWLEQVGQHAFSDPARAAELLERAARIDPTSPHFAALHGYFDEVQQAVRAMGQFRPQGDGTNLGVWFADVHGFLQPYLDDLSDAGLHNAVRAVHQAGIGWLTVLDYLALGRRQPAINLLRRTADLLRPHNEQVAAWLGSLATRLPDADYVEQLSPNESLAAALVAGWQAWDQGDAVGAAAHGQRALEFATTPGEQMAANRLRELGSLLDEWLASHGEQDQTRTDQAETRALGLLLDDEEAERHTFAEQMPDTSVYLRAMNRGVVAYMRQSSSAGWRALYVHYVLRGVLALQEDNLDEADFWRSAALNCVEEARTHRLFQVLDRTLTGRRLVRSAQRALNAVSRPVDLEGARQALNAPLAAELLGGAQSTVIQAEEALRHWSDGDFYNARQSLDMAVENINTAVEVAHLEIPSFVAWLTRLRDAAAQLQQTRLTIEQGAVTTSTEPDPALSDALTEIVSTTQQMLGPNHVHQVRQWDEMYRAVLETYTSQRLVRRDKLAAFERHFSSLFINKHPLYPLFRYWENVIQNMPPDEVEDDLIEMDGFVPTPDAPAFLDDDQGEPEPVPISSPDAPGSDLPWNWIIAGALLVLIVVIGFAVLRTIGSQDEGEDDGNQESSAPAGQVVTAIPSDPPRATLTLPPTPVPTRAAVSVLASPTAAAPDVEPVEPVVIPTEPPVTDTPAPPTSTPTPAVSPTPIEIMMAEEQATPNRSALSALSALEERESLPWGDGLVPGSDGTWLLSTEADDEAVIEFTPELMAELFIPGAANFFVRADVVLRLVSYDPDALQNGEVSVGFGAQNTDEQRTIGQVQFLEEAFVSLGLNQNGQFRSATQFPLQGETVKLSIQRTNSNTLTFLVDDRSLGDSVFLFARGEPLALLLYASGQDVVAEVSTFEVEFRPRSYLP